MSTDNHINLEKAVYDICSKYNCIKAETLEIVAPVYYPIITIELTLEEKSFEDFDTVELTVLKLINLEFRDSQTIASLLGLKYDYIDNIKKLLYAYRHIDQDCHILEEGKESVKLGKKVQLIKSRQRFQLDPIDLRLIRLDNEVCSTNLKDETAFLDNIIILDHENYISSDEIVKSLSENDFARLFAQKKGILNTNIKTISNLKYISTSYVQACIIKQYNDPLLIFAKREDFSKKYPNKFIWLPFSVPNEEIRTHLGLTNCCISSEENNLIIQNRVNLMLEYGKSGKLLEDFNKRFEGIPVSYCLNSGEILLSHEKKAIYIKGDNGFTALNERTVRYLYRIATFGCLIVCDDTMYGSVIKLFITNKALKDLASRLKEFIDSLGEQTEKKNFNLCIRRLSDFSAAGTFNEQLDAFLRLKKSNDTF